MNINPQLHGLEIELSLRLSNADLMLDRFNIEPSDEDLRVIALLTKTIASMKGAK
jgi:hypothetical protein